MRVSYAKAVYGTEEREAVAYTLASGRPLVGGVLTRGFEREIAGLFGKRHGVFVNSGSSANLLAVELLDLPPGSEVITPVLTFATTVAPLLQKGLVPVFVDVEPDTYQANLDHVDLLIGKQTRAFMIPLLLGNIPDMARLKGLTNDGEYLFIEDSCDSLGGTFCGIATGAYSDLSTTSFYASHVITAGGTGGMVMMNDYAWADRARILRGWGRRTEILADSEDVAARFSGHLSGFRYDGKFIFEEVGYNLLGSEMSAAFGLEQLKKLDVFTKARSANFAALYDFFRQYEEWFLLPRSHPDAVPTWLAFPLTIREKAPFTRLEFVLHLEQHGIQTRPIFTGNILRQPGFRKLAERARSEYPAADAIMQRGLLLGCHHGMTGEELEYVKEIITGFLREH
jgi:CDP-6-deoxy-D-xylo-4-hexulose-3-dehydrase